MYLLSIHLNEDGSQSLNFRTLTERPFVDIDLYGETTKDSQAEAEILLTKKQALEISSLINLAINKVENNYEPKK